MDRIFLLLVNNYAKVGSNMCADGSESHYEDAVGECEECGSKVDCNGDTVEACCNYAREYCKSCGYGACDGGC